MKRIFPEPKHITDKHRWSDPFSCIRVDAAHVADIGGTDAEYLVALRLRDWKELEVTSEPRTGSYTLTLIQSPGSGKAGEPQLMEEQGYRLETGTDGATIRFARRAGLNYALSTLKKMFAVTGTNLLRLPFADIVDYPSIPVRAVAPTFSWYAGYGRIGFDSQLFGEEQWISYLHTCADDKINQLNMVMYGYWPFSFDEYPETVFRNVPLRIWNQETERWITIRYSHPNVEDNYFERLIAYAHELDIRIFAYVGLNSYNGAYSIKHPEKRMKAPAGQKFLNDFDSLCLSDSENVTYIIKSMQKIASLGVDGFTLEESEEGFWFCECDACKSRWHAVSSSPGEAKHKANMWLLKQIYDAIREINPDAVIGIRAFRQPPLEKDPAFLRECVDSMPADIDLFWAPALYVPPTEFKKWVAAFGPERIWGRDTESNSITSTMGRLYRIFASNMIRYEDEANVQVIERDIEQHITSVSEHVHGINGFMFEIYGYFMHQWAHANYGWGSRMDRQEFFRASCEAAFGRELGEKVLYLLTHIVTIHESQIPLYTTPFPFQKNTMTDADIPAIRDAIAMHPGLTELLKKIMEALQADVHLRNYLPHFRKIENAHRRNRVIYDMALAALDYERETDPVQKDALLDVILDLNEQDFAIAKEMFFDLNPVCETGVKSCMFPYHEMKRLIHNIRHPERPDDDIICSGIEALGWLWL